MLQMARTKPLQSRAFLLRTYLARRLKRCCLTPSGMRSGSLVACLHGVSKTMRLGRDGSEAWPKEDGSGSCRPRQGTTGRHALPCHDESLRPRARDLQSGGGLGPRQLSAIGPSPLAQGPIEKNVRDSPNPLLQGMLQIGDLATLNAWREQYCLEL